MRYDQTADPFCGMPTIKSADGEKRIDLDAYNVRVKEIKSSFGRGSLQETTELSKFNPKGESPTSQKKTGGPSILDTIEVACFVCNVTEDSVREKNGPKQVVLARRLVWEVLRRHTKHSLSCIGKYTNGSSNAAVSMGTRKITNQIKDGDGNLRSKLREIEYHLRLTKNPQ